MVLIFQGEHHTGSQHPALLTGLYANLFIYVDRLPELQDKNHVEDKQQVPQHLHNPPTHTMLRTPREPQLPSPRGGTWEKPTRYFNLNVPAAPRG